MRIDFETLHASLSEATLATTYSAASPGYEQESAPRRPMPLPEERLPLMAEWWKDAALALAQLLSPVSEATVSATSLTLTFPASLEARAVMMQPQMEAWMKERVAARFYKLSQPRLAEEAQERLQELDHILKWQLLRCLWH